MESVQPILAYAEVNKKPWRYSHYLFHTTQQTHMKYCLQEIEFYGIIWIQISDNMLVFFSNVCHNYLDEFPNGRLYGMLDIFDQVCPAYN